MLLEKTLKILEFDKIIEKITELTTCEIARNYARSCVPVFDKDEIDRLLCENDDACVILSRKGMPPLAGIKDIRYSVKRAASGSILSTKELLNIAAVLKAAGRTIDYCNSAAQDIENSVSAYIYRLVEDRYLMGEITRCILSEDEIADDASPLLYSIRKQILHTQNAIKDKLNEMIRSERYAKAIQDNIITIRADRYCIPVKAEHKSSFDGLVHDTSSSGQTVFIEPSFVVEANNKIRQLRGDEAAEIERILSELSSMTAEREAILICDCETLSYLDFLFAKARYSLEIKGSKPIINEEGKINLLNARHPLIDKNKVVPTTFYLDSGNCMVITGPNTGGKTVTLKTVGLLTCMMQAGLLIPADDKSVLSIYTGIFADIGDEQSIAQSLSTFSSHMKNIVEILGACDYRSLILFDELGAGTDPTEGSCLAISILECAHHMGATVIATTHYSELKIYASTTPGFINSCCEFDVEKLAPTYRLLIGVPGKSNAFAISQKLGLDPQIISRAKEFLTGEDLRFEDMLQDIERNRLEIENARSEAARLKIESEQMTETIRKEMDRLDSKKDEILMKAREDAQRIINKAKVSADKMLSEIRRAQNNQNTLKDAQSAKAQFLQETDSISGSVRIGDDKYAQQPIPTILKEGQNVRIISIGANGTILKAPNKNGECYVQAGIMKVYLPLADLRIIREESGEVQKATQSKSNTNMRAMSIKSELDVRGATVEEAIAMIERHLSDAHLAHQDRFTIIHGKGTGALRKGVHSYLSGNKSIKSFRIGEYGEGDAGVTVVQLR